MLVSQQGECVACPKGCVTEGNNSQRREETIMSANATFSTDFYSSNLGCVLNLSFEEAVAQIDGDEHSVGEDPRSINIAHRISASNLRVIIKSHSMRYPSHLHIESRSADGGSREACATPQHSCPFSQM